MAVIESRLDGRGVRVAVVASRFNHPISRRLVEGCHARLSELGCERIDVHWVPGAFELPLAARACGQTGRYDAIAALGVVIRGSTPHFEYVCRAVTDGCREAGSSLDLPVAFGVLTTDTVEQALARAAAPGESGRNVGQEAADVAVEMARLLKQIEKGS